MNVSCPYCNRDAELVKGNVIYPHRLDLCAKNFWRCTMCQAHVGCHDRGVGQGNGDKPLGRLANAELRQWKQRAHSAFDPLWKARHMQRKEAYRWLAEQLGIASQNCHIGEFDVDACRAVVAAVEGWRHAA